MSEYIGFATMEDGTEVPISWNFGTKKERIVDLDKLPKDAKLSDLLKYARAFGVKIDIDIVPESPLLTEEKDGK